MSRLPARALALALAVGPAAGCGSERPESPRIFDAPARGGDQRLRYPHAGFELTLPRSFVVTRAPAPQLFRASLEDAFVSGFAYRRREVLPKTGDQLRTARDRLVRAAEDRDRSFRLSSSKLTRVAGAPAIELVGEQTISAGRLRIRSVHVYKGRAEYVVELGAPVGDFPRFDRSTASRIRQTLRLTGEVSDPPARRKRAERGGGAR